jgi:hypothetical protein
MRKLQNHLLPSTLLLLGATACDRSALKNVAQEDAPLVLAAGQREVVFHGACDASGAVSLDARHFAVADDEDNVLRVYDAEKGGPPLFDVDVSSELGLKKKKNPESDIEAATRLGERAYWLTSHGRTKSAKRHPDRFRFFATELPRRGKDPKLIGEPYRSLIDDMIADPRLAPFKLEAAAELAPKDEGGINLEGLTATPDGKVLIGFRNPIPDSGALIVPLENPAEIMEGEAVRLGEPLLLPVGGAGIRGLSLWHGEYLVIAGPFDGNGVSHLYRWDGKGAPRLEPGLNFANFNPEGFFTPEERSDILLLSDDGTRKIEGKDCKALKDDDLKRFRGLWLSLSTPAL